MAKYIRLGVLDVDTINVKDVDQSIQLNIAERIPHPNYTNTKYNDIALFRMDQSIQFNKIIRPACLPEVPRVPVDTAIASGWGLTQYGGDASNALLKVVLDFFTNAECNSIYEDAISPQLANGIVNETQMCAGSRTEHRDTCQVIFCFFLVFCNFFFRILIEIEG